VSRCGRPELRREVDAPAVFTGAIGGGPSRTRTAVLLAHDGRVGERPDRVAYVHRLGSREALGQLGRLTRSASRIRRADLFDKRFPAVRAAISAGMASNRHCDHPPVRGPLSGGSMKARPGTRARCLPGPPPRSERDRTCRCASRGADEPNGPPRRAGRRCHAGCAIRATRFGRRGWLEYRFVELHLRARETWLNDVRWWRLGSMSIGPGALALDLEQLRSQSVGSPFPMSSAPPASAASRA